MYNLRDSNLDIFSVVTVGYVESSQLSVDIQLDNHQINSDQNKATWAMNSWKDVVIRRKKKKRMRLVRIELTTSGLWDPRSSNWAKAASIPFFLPHPCTLNLRVCMSVRIPFFFSMFFLLRRIVSYLWESVKVPFRPVRSDVETVQSLQIDSLRVYPS